MPEIIIDCAKGVHDVRLMREVPFWRYLLTGMCKKYKYCTLCNWRGPVYYQGPLY